MTDLIKRLRKSEGSPTLRSVLLGMFNAEKTCLDAADALERAQWQPIETAPDMVNVLLYQEGWAINPVIVGRRHGHTWLSDCFDIDGADQRPTHWMPLPNPPEELEE